MSHGSVYINKKNAKTLTLSLLNRECNKTYLTNRYMHNEHLSLKCNLVDLGPENTTLMLSKEIINLHSEFIG